MQEENRQNVKKSSKWQQAIEYAGLKIKRHQKHIRALRKAQQFFREQIENKAPWPGEKAES